MTRIEDIFPRAEDGVVSLEPLVLRRTVRWGECDPAGIVFTPRFLDYCIEAYEAFLDLMLGGPMHSAKVPLGVDFPCRGVELDFRAPLPLDARLQLEVRAAPPRSRTVDLYITGSRMDADGPVLAFLARITPVTVDTDSRAAVPMPEPLRRAVEDYAARFPAKKDVQK